MGAQQFVTLGVVFALRSMDLTEYETLIRIIYGIMQAVCVITWFHILRKVKEIPEGGDKITIPALIQFGKEVKPKKEATVQTHDRESWNEEAQKVAIGLVVVTGIHVYWKSLVPLVIQSIMVPMGIFGHSLFKAYVLGYEVARPFPVNQPFSSAGETEPVKDEKKADKKAIKEEKKTK